MSEDQPKPKPTTYERWKRKLENNKILASLMIVVFVLGVLSLGIKTIKDLYTELKPEQPQITMFATITGEGYCHFFHDRTFDHHKNILDIAINNNSDHDILLKSVSLAPLDIHGDPDIAGELDVTNVYSVSLASWLGLYGWARLLGSCPTLEAAGKAIPSGEFCRPIYEPIRVQDISANKYVVEAGEPQRFVVHLGMDEDVWRGDYTLGGSFQVEIQTDRGETLRTDPLEFAICGVVYTEEEKDNYLKVYALDEGVILAMQGLIDEAWEKFQQADSLMGDEPIPADLWNKLCWYASLYGRGQQAMPACEAALDQEPDNGSYRDSRGLARALVGDISGAIEDFSAYIDWSEQRSSSSEEIEMRRMWISELKAGRNPFTPEVLEKLK